MKKKLAEWISIALLLVLSTACAVTQEDLAARANLLFKMGKRVDALPLYEELAKQFPKEWLYAERLADCLGAKSAQSTDAAEVKALRLREREAAKRAVELGDTAEFVRMMANLDLDAPVMIAPASKGGLELQAAEKAFTAGNFAEAMTHYTAAAQADPNLYEAPLYAGDTAFTQGDLKTASQWFARAILVNPDRETAYRYWGDAIMKYGNDPELARQKFIDAIVAEPYNRLAWQGLQQWAQQRRAVLQPPQISVPGEVKTDPKKPNTINILMDAEGMDDKKHPGSSAWLMYTMTRAAYQGETFKKEFPNEKQYRHSLKEESQALNGVIESVRANKIDRSKLDSSLQILLELSDAKMVECFLLINGADQGIAQDYEAYRKDHRTLLHQYIDRFVLHGGVDIKSAEIPAGGKHGM